MLRYVIELFELPLPSQLRPMYMLLCDVLRKALFEFEEAPVLAQRLVMSIQPDQEQIRDDRQRYGARHALGFLRHLHLAQMEAALQFFDRDLHAPTPRVYTEDGPRGRLREIGHDDLHSFRPIVTPFLREYDRDITQIMQRRTANKDPVIVAAAIGFVAGSPWRVKWPKGCLRPRFGLSVLSPIRYSTPSGGGGSDRSVAAATSVITAWASHCPDRTIRTVVQ